MTQLPSVGHRDVWQAKAAKTEGLVQFETEIAPGSAQVVYSVSSVHF